MYRSPDQNQRESIRLILHQALGDEYRRLSYKGITTANHSESKDTGVVVRFCDNQEHIEVTSSEGKGAVDGMFKALSKQYSGLGSISNLRLEAIEIGVDLKNSESGTDALVGVQIRFCNKRQCATFSDISHSFIASACKCLLKAVEFFLNSELAFKKIREFIKDATDRNRHDLVSKYQMQLATIVNTNIAEYDVL